MPPISIAERSPIAPIGKRTLVLCVADCHYGAEWIVRGLRGEILNRYNPEVFGERMDDLLTQVREIIAREGSSDVQLLLCGDSLDGMLRNSQLMKLRWGVIESCMRFSEHMAQWIAALSQYATVSVCGVDGNHTESVLHGASDNWATPFYGTGAGIVKSVLNPMIQHWMRTGAVTLLGDIYVVSKLAEQTGFTAATATQQYAPSIIEELNRTGLIGTYYGAKVINLINPYKADNVTPVIDEKRLYILPSAASADMRPLKVVFEGDVQSTESTNIDDLAYEIRLDQWFGAGIVIGKTPTMSVYKDSTT